MPDYLRAAGQAKASQEELQLLSLKEVEARHICRVLDTVGGNKSEAARILGINRKTLRMKLKRMDTDKPK